jgi:hypothetical protein
LLPTASALAVGLAAGTALGHATAGASSVDSSNPSQTTSSQGHTAITGVITTVQGMVIEIQSTDGTTVVPLRRHSQVSKVIPLAPSDLVVGQCVRIAGPRQNAVTVIGRTVSVLSGDTPACGPQAATSGSPTIIPK